MYPEPPSPRPCPHRTCQCCTCVSSRSTARSPELTAFGLVRRLALNCGSSSVKARLYSFGAKDGPLESVAKASASGIGAKGQPIKISVKWEEGGEDGVEKQQDEIDCRSPSFPPHP